MKQFNSILYLFFRQASSDKMNLALTLLTTPFFILFYWLIFTSESSDANTVNNSSFENFIPGLLVFSMIMIVFSSAIAITSEKVNGTLLRIQMTGISESQIAFGFGLVQFSIAWIAFLLSLLVAYMVGFDKIWQDNSFLIFASLNMICMIAIGIILGAISNSINRAFLIASMVMFLLLLFSGIVFPKPNIIFKVSILPNQEFYAFDILPTSLTISSFRKILNANNTFIDLKYDLGFLFLQSIFYSTCSYIVFRFKSRSES
ncbi:ABC transporter permease [Leptospira sp. GIMC2001]|uniref:ABC transporter permease n=1 Tax=Leptospira sp. GIMC2001 TaxID=1513297 RepID=UPI00234AA858|nr:ABC transporter permease [Leptospira sp. GIMC2001]WCL50904.1 ABC transporter permease [Leptospira sp. GIMC2001]